MSESNEGPGESLMAPGAIKTRADFEAAQEKGQILAVENGVKNPESIALPCRKEPEALADPARKVPVEAQAKTGGHSVSVVTQVIPQETEELVLPMGKPEEKKTAPVTKSQDKVKDPAKVPEDEVVLAQVSAKALARELVNRFVNFMKQ